MRTCTRRLEWDAAHRVLRHESKCCNLHGHRYVAELTCDADQLDDLGRVVDFGAIKGIVGAWIDTYWDHGTIAHKDDTELIRVCLANNWRLYTMNQNPTAENLAQELWRIATDLLAQAAENVRVARVRIYETPNCWADYP